MTRWCSRKECALGVECWTEIRNNNSNNNNNKNSNNNNNNSNNNNSNDILLLITILLIIMMIMIIFISDDNNNNNSNSNNNNDNSVFTCNGHIFFSSYFKSYKFGVYYLSLQHRHYYHKEDAPPSNQWITMKKERTIAGQLKAFWWRKVQMEQLNWNTQKHSIEWHWSFTGQWAHNTSKSK